MNLSFLEKSIGIDFQKERIIIALLGRTITGMVLLDYSILTNDTKETGEFDRRFRENLKKFIHQNKLSNIRGAICFPRQTIILKYINIPAPKIEDIEAMLEYEIEKHVPLKKEDIYYDFHIIKKKDHLFNVLIAVARKSQVHRYIKILEETSIIPSIISLSTLSNFSLLSFNNYNQKLFNAIIEISPQYINISFILNGSVHYMRSVSIPDNQELLKGLIKNIEPNTNMNTAVEKFSEFVLKEISISLASFRENPSYQAVDSYFISGGGLLSLAIKKSLEQRLTGAVEILDPLTKLRCNNIAEKDRYILANAVGTSLQNHVKNIISINLLPEASRSSTKDHSLRAMLILGGIFLLILLGTLFSIILKDNIKLTKIENELKEIKKEVILAETLERQYEKLRKHKLTFLQLDLNHPSRLIILKELSSLLPSDLWLSSLAIKKDAVEIIGSANSTSTLIPLLESSEIFNNVHFLDSIKHKKNREHFKIKLPLQKAPVK